MFLQFGNVIIIDNDKLQYCVPNETSKAIGTGGRRWTL